MEIKLWDNFSKRRNSTKAPSSDDVPVIRSAVLKDGCSKTHPSFFIQGIAEYTYVQAFGRYYFVDNVEYDINDAEWLHCSIDVLATWKAEILATSAFVSYSTSDYNSYIIDDRIAQKVTIGVDYDSESDIFSTSNKCYIISTVNNDPLYGGITSYAIDDTALRDITGLLLNDDSLWDSLMAIFGDIGSSIIACREVPVSREAFATTQGADVHIGNYNTQIFGYVTDGRLEDTCILNIPHRYSDFRRVSMTRYMLALPFIGVVDIDAAELVDETSLQIEMQANAITGVINYSVYVNNALLNTYAGSFGRMIPVGSSTTDVMGTIQGYTAAAGSVIGGVMAGMKGSIPGQLMSICGLIAGVSKSTVAEFTKDFSVVGGFGGGFGEYIIQNYYIIEYTHDSQTEPSELTTLYGRPLHKVVQLNSLTGYVETVGFSINIDELQSVRDMINTAMDSGVYLE